MYYTDNIKYKVKYMYNTHNIKYKIKYIIHTILSIVRIIHTTTIIYMYVYCYDLFISIYNITIITIICNNFNQRLTMI